METTIIRAIHQPTEVEAVCYDGADTAYPEPFAAAIFEQSNYPRGATVMTPDGPARANVGDYLVRPIDGSAVFVVAAAAFASLYHEQATPTGYIGEPEPASEPLDPPPPADLLEPEPEPEAEPEEATLAEEPAVVEPEAEPEITEPVEEAAAEQDQVGDQPQAEVVEEAAD